MSQVWCTGCSANRSIGGFSPCLPGEQPWAVSLLNWSHPTEAPAGPSFAGPDACPLLGSAEDMNPSPWGTTSTCCPSVYCKGQGAGVN